MAHYAFINPETNLVVEVIPGRNEDEIVDGISDWEAYYSTKREGLIAVRTSYNTYGGVHYTDGQPSADQSKALRKNYAGLGYTYDEERDAFIPPQRFDSWVLNEDTCLWEAPIERPTEGDWVWDEQAGAWVEA